MATNLEQDMQVAFLLAMKVGHSEISSYGYYFTWRENLELQIGVDNADTVGAWADGLMHKAYDNMFKSEDIEKFGITVAAHLVMMKSALAQLGDPVQLTKEIMRNRGYTVK